MMMGYRTKLISAGILSTVAAVFAFLLLGIADLLEWYLFFPIGLGVQQAVYWGLVLWGGEDETTKRE